MDNLVFADHHDGQLLPSTARVVTAACQLGGGVHVLVVGSRCQAVADAAARLAGVSKVLVLDDPDLAHMPAEPIADAIAELALPYRAILGAAGSTANNILPRAAAKLDRVQISDVSRICSADTFERPMLASNAVATVQVLDPQFVLTVRASSFAATLAAAPAEISGLSSSGIRQRTRLIERQPRGAGRLDLGAARVVVAGGRGLGTKERFEALIFPLADKLGAAVGASRAAVDAGFVPSDCQVGQTGRVVAPELYIACGISGAVQHLAGMKDSKVIVAVNNDPDAPIFAVADYGLVADLYHALTELTAKL